MKRSRNRIVPAVQIKWWERIVGKWCSYLKEWAKTLWRLYPQYHGLQKKQLTDKKDDGEENSHDASMEKNPREEALQKREPLEKALQIKIK